MVSSTSPYVSIINFKSTYSIFLQEQFLKYELMAMHTLSNIILFVFFASISLQIKFRNQINTMKI